MGQAKFIIEKTSVGKSYFTLQDKKGEVVVISEMYDSKRACYKGVESVKTIALEAEIVDRT